MTDLHPLTDTIVSALADGDDEYLAEVAGEASENLADVIDPIVREYVTPPAQVAESGVRFPDMPETPVEVAGNFIQSGNQMQMVLVGTEPVLVVQPEYDAAEDRVTLITTAVDLPPAGLVHVLEALLDGARTIVAVQEQQAREMEEADRALREASDAHDMAFCDVDDDVQRS